MFNPIEIGMRITQQQKSLGLKQKDIVERSGISKSAISNYISGTRVPDTEAIYKISIALNTSIEWLLVGKTTSENFTPDEQKLLYAYQAAAPGIKEAVDKLLDVQTPEGHKSSTFEPGKKAI